MTVSKPDYSALVNSQREYFLSGCTRSSSWRRAQLEAFKAMFTENHDELCDALWKDLRRNVVDVDLMDVAYNVNVSFLHRLRGAHTVNRFSPSSVLRAIKNSSETNESAK